MKKLKFFSVISIIGVSMIIQMTVFAANSSNTKPTAAEKSLFDSNKNKYDTIVRDLDSQLKKGTVDKTYYDNYKKALSEKYLASTPFSRTPEEEQATINDLKDKFKQWADEEKQSSTQTSTDLTVPVTTTSAPALTASTMTLPAAASSVTSGSNSFSYFNRGNALDYINSWWNNRNSAYKDFGDRDCANFASQVLVAGGISMNSSWHNWPDDSILKIFDPWDVTATFNNNVSFKGYFSPKVYQVEVVSGKDMLANFQHYYDILWHGDIIQVCDDTTSNNPFHAFEVSGFSGGDQVLMSAHSDNWQQKLLRDTCNVQGDKMIIIYRIKNGY
jgi:hypothetical protein